MALTILKPGLLTTVQDLGRIKYQQHGVIVSGAMDSFSLRVANLLVGNDEAEGVLEVTLSGPTIRFEEDTLFSITGADLSPTINQQVIPLWKPILARKGSVLSFGPSKFGCRSYLAIAGGFLLEKVLGSMSTYIRAGIGGFQGRALVQGDVIRFKRPSPAAIQLIKGMNISEGITYQATNWTINQSILSFANHKRVVRLIRGPHFDYFKKESKNSLFQEKFKVSPQSDRMGYRLTGHSLLLEKPLELLSEAVTFGTIQVPPDGNPIILLADRQTIGGYPKIGQIAAVDLSIIAQAKPGEGIFFEEITLQEAERLYIQREQELACLKAGLWLKTISL
jgi:antagonist of KipI